MSLLVAFSRGMFLEFVLDLACGFIFLCFSSPFVRDRTLFLSGVSAFPSIVSAGVFRILRVSFYAFLFLLLPIRHGHVGVLKVNVCLGCFAR